MNKKLTIIVMFIPIFLISTSVMGQYHRYTFSDLPDLKEDVKLKSAEDVRLLIMKAYHEKLNQSIS